MELCQLSGSFLPLPSHCSPLNPSKMSCGKGEDLGFSVQCNRWVCSGKAEIGNNRPTIWNPHSKKCPSANFGWTLDLNNFEKTAQVKKISFITSDSSVLSKLMSDSIEADSSIVDSLLNENMHTLHSENTLIWRHYLRQTFIITNATAQPLKTNYSWMLHSNQSDINCNFAALVQNWISATEVEILGLKTFLSLLFKKIQKMPENNANRWDNLCNVFSFQDLYTLGIEHNMLQGIRKVTCHNIFKET